MMSPGAALEAQSMQFPEYTHESPSTAAAGCLAGGTACASKAPL